MSDAQTTTQITTPAQEGGARGQGQRPSFLPISIREKAALYAAYMPFLANGGIFVPTTRPAQLGDDIYLMLTLVDDPQKLAIAGKVVWITPAGTPGRQQGIGVQFPDDQSGVIARQKIDALVGAALRSARPTHTL